ncbi:MAG: diphosphomevalonate decarboxylase [Bacteroidales bacterium]
MMENDLSVRWKSPSNIALIKYWGKKENTQYPINPSLSMTLSTCYTDTSIHLSPRSNNENDFEYFFEQKKLNITSSKLPSFFENFKKEHLWANDYFFHIESKNTFPHSVGIASSASSMSALALCLIDLDSQITGKYLNLQKVSSLAREGSGSACRSVYGGYSIWGNSSFHNSVDEYAKPFLNWEIHPIFQNMRDRILIVDTEGKKVSSTEGHCSMINHPYRNSRITQANNNLSTIIAAIKDGDFDTFAHVCENEALSLHALMMSSDLSYLLLESQSINIIEKLKNFRERENIKLCFTIDAGPNIHILYPEEQEDRINEFIEEELLTHCENSISIQDQIGKGPEKVIND